jgi:hypothetical protein
MHQEVIQECPECRGFHRGQYAHCEECWAVLALPSGLGRAPGVLPSTAGALTQLPLPADAAGCPPIAGGHQGPALEPLPAIQDVELERKLEAWPVQTWGDRLQTLGTVLDQLETVLVGLNRPADHWSEKHTWAMGRFMGGNLRRYLTLAGVE